MRYFIGLGSNCGDRLTNLQRACRALERFGVVVEKSAIYETEPWGVEEQQKFFNAVLVLETNLRPFRLLRKLKALELALGRKRTFVYGPRVIDLDVLEWDGAEVHSSVLHIPHPHLLQRAFVLVPFSDIEPDFRLRNGQTVVQANRALHATGSVFKRIEKW